ncbi:MAG TPA: hypothetical protein VH722_07190 [Alphaproteobacteria bacterium]|jgi:hypothetical protein|nr:hypothetical protein [Alphaproteobacteria bacterium]
MSARFRDGSWGNWRGWLFLAVMVAVLVGIDFAILPRHTEMSMISAAAWGWIVVVAGLAVCRGRTWRFADLIRGRS